MLAMTQDAAEAVEQLVEHADLPATAVVRLTAEEGRSNGAAASRELIVELVAAAPADDLVVPEARLAVEPGSLPFLDDKVLDADSDGGEVEFRLYSQPSGGV